MVSIIYIRKWVTLYVASAAFGTQRVRVSSGHRSQSEQHGPNRRESVRTQVRILSHRFFYGGVKMSVVEDIRTNWAINDAKRDEGLTTPENVFRYDDIAYGTDKKYQVLDVYKPLNKKKGKLPVIVNIHGGAWVYGDKQLYQYYAMSLCEMGFAVVNMSYRLAPESSFYDQISDINTVLNWMCDNKEKYGLDIENVFAVGDSAGAHLLGIYTCIFTNSEYAKRYDIKLPKGLSINAIALNCGKYFFYDEKTNNYLDDEVVKIVFADENGNIDSSLINLTENIGDEFPPVYIMTCFGDFLKEQAPILVKTLEEKKIPFLYRMYGDRNNELGHVFHCNIKLDIAKKCNEDEARFFRMYIK